MQFWAITKRVVVVLTDVSGQPIITILRGLGLLDP